MEHLIYENYCRFDKKLNCAIISSSLFINFGATTFQIRFLKMRKFTNLDGTDLRYLPSKSA